MPTEATTDSQLTMVPASKAGRSKHGAGEQAGESRMYVQLFAVLVAARQLRTALFALKNSKHHPY